MVVLNCRRVEDVIASLALTLCVQQPQRSLRWTGMAAASSAGKPCLRTFDYHWNQVSVPGNVVLDGGLPAYVTFILEFILDLG